MKKRVIFVLTVVIMLLGNGCSKPVESITVYAAASTTDLITTVAKEFEKQEHISVKLNFASSGTLVRQLEAGAAGDLYISASKKWMEWGISSGLISESNAFLRNRLALIIPSGSDKKKVEINETFDLPAFFEGKISMGDPAHVPSGQYSKEALEYLGCYEELKERILPAQSARAALAVVEMDEVDAGIVYLTDALVSNKVKKIGLFPESTHSPIIYMCGLLKEGSSKGELFYRYLQDSPEAEVLYKKYGFNR